MKTNARGFLTAAVIVFCAVGAARADIILSVDRENGQSGNRAPIGVFDANTDPLATQAGGLTADNYYFSDREYVIGSVPALLEGAEYVRTFNTDKDNGPTQNLWSDGVVYQPDTYIFGANPMSDSNFYSIIVPEPITAGLLALGGVGVLLRRRRRR